MKHPFHERPGGVYPGLPNTTIKKNVFFSPISDDFIQALSGYKQYGGYIISTPHVL